jgi:hypothetical protein
MANDIINPRVLLALEAERVSQDQEWGGAEHDDFHSYEDWQAYILRQIGLLTQDLTNRDQFTGNALQNLAIRRGRRAVVYTRMSKIGALAIACMESVERERLRDSQSH